MSTTAEIRALVPDFIFKRGKEIAHSNKLHSVSFEGPLLERSSATCTGSNPDDKYELRISISGESSKPACQCSCPAAQKSKGSFCKHIVALLILRAEELLFSKGHENELNLSEFKHVEVRLTEDKIREYFVTAKQPLETSSNETKGRLSSVDSTVSPVIKNTQRRILPSWISAHVTKVDEKRKLTREFIKKSNKKESKIQEENEQGSSVDQTELVANGMKHCGFVDGSLPKRPAYKTCKRKSIKESSENGDSDSKYHLKYDMGRSFQGSNRQENVNSALGKGRLKMKKIKYSERDPNAETQEDFLSDTQDLTCEDLVKLAKEHLEKENEAKIDTVGDSMVKAMESTPSVKEWYQISNTSMHANDMQNNTEVLNANTCIENVVDDMLGLFFGPSLNKAVNCQSGQSGGIVETDAMNVAFPIVEKPDISLPVIVDSLRQSKKRTSLKDKVMMYLGGGD